MNAIRTDCSLTSTIQSVPATNIHRIRISKFCYFRCVFYEKLATNLASDSHIDVFFICLTYIIKISKLNSLQCTTNTSVWELCLQWANLNSHGLASLTCSYKKGTDIPRTSFCSISSTLLSRLKSNCFLSVIKTRRIATETMFAKNTSKHKEFHIQSPYFELQEHCYSSKSSQFKIAKTLKRGRNCK